MESSDSQCSKQKYSMFRSSRDFIYFNFLCNGWWCKSCFPRRSKSRLPNNLKFAGFFFKLRKKCKNLRCFLMQNDFFVIFQKICIFCWKKRFQKGVKLVLLRIAERRDLYHNVAESLSFLEMKEFFKLAQYSSRLDRS